MATTVLVLTALIVQTASSANGRVTIASATSKTRYTKQRDPNDDHIPEKVLDGDIETFYHSYTQVKGDPQWLRLDLSVEAFVQAVTITNRLVSFMDLIGHCCWGL